MNSPCCGDGTRYLEGLWLTFLDRGIGLSTKPSTSILSGHATSLPERPLKQVMKSAVQGSLPIRVGAAATSTKG
eukprot:6180345-Pleurochrysis_carterae.AAC.1